MSFWAQRLGQPIPPAATPAPPAGPPAPWWQANPTLPPATQRVVAVPQQMPQPGSVASTDEQHFGDLLRQGEYTTTKAKSAQRQDSCPDCGSGNYMAGANEEARSQPRCFDCGYNGRFSQTGSGPSMTGITQNAAPPRPARVQNVATGAPPMGTVIQHL